MKKVGIEKLKPTVLDDKSSRWELTEPLETTSLSLNRYRLEPGVGLPSGIHAHMVDLLPRLQARESRHGISGRA